MSQIDEAANRGSPGRRGSRGLRFWIIIVALPMMITAASGVAGYWYFFLRERTEVAKANVPEPDLPLPFYLEIKPFVVSAVNSAGASHFVQMGLNLTLSGSNAAEVVMAVLPEVQDTIRQTTLGFKVDDIVTPAGVDRLRETMIANVNRALLGRLGADRVKRLGGGDPDRGIVKNIYFSTFIIE
jgi:flagellar basal body-associated protein FliL